MLGTREYDAIYELLYGDAQDEIFNVMDELHPGFAAAWDAITDDDAALGEAMTEMMSTVRGYAISHIDGLIRECIEKNVDGVTNNLVNEMVMSLVDSGLVDERDSRAGLDAAIETIGVDKLYELAQTIC